MRLRKRRGQAISLVLAAHPVASLLVTLAVTVAAATSGRTGRECLLVAATVLTGQVTVGWLDDVVDRNRDRQGGRPEQPAARGRGAGTSRSRWAGSTRGTSRSPSPVPCCCWSPCPSPTGPRPDWPTWARC